MEIKERAKSLSNVVQSESMKAQKRPRTRIMVKMERLLAVWMRDLHDRKYPISMKITKTKSKLLFEQIKNNMEDKTELENNETFVASTGWFYNFIDRMGFRNIKLKGEAGSADVEAGKKYPSEFQKIISEGEYSEDQIFNVDETSTYFKQPTSRSFVPKESSGDDLAGTKLKKERCTFLFGGNASGDLKLKPLIIWKSKDPQCFKKNKIIKSNLPVIYRHSKK